VILLKALAARLEAALPRIWQRRGPWALLLWPLSLLMQGLVKLRQGLYRRGILKSEAVRVPVIVVGNVVVGGGGKTPTVIALVEHLREKGYRPGIISRGYGRDGNEVIEVLPTRDVREVGDEPALIQRRTNAPGAFTTSTPVFVGRRRIDAARALLARHRDVNVLISDDGLQHLALQRDVEICVFGDRGIGNGFLLPAGPLREPWPRALREPWGKALKPKPSEIVLHTGQRKAFEQGHAAQRELAREALTSDGQRIPLQGLGDKALIAVAGTAQPQAFFDMLQGLGLKLAQIFALPDHASVDDYAASLQGLDESAILLCTEKDAAKLWQVRLKALAVPLDFTLPKAFLDELDRQLAEAFTIKLSSAYDTDASSS
jgi:tetraacyldisaccharide 4'-kinase